MGQGHKLMGPTLALQNPAVRPRGRERRILITPAFTMAHKTRSFISAGVPPSTWKTDQTARYSYEFIRDAFPSFDYPKRAFNDLPLRGYLISTVFDSVRKWNEHTPDYRFSWKSGQVKCFSFCPLYKKKGLKVILSYRKPFLFF